MKQKRNSQGEITAYGFACGLVQKSYGVELQMIDRRCYSLLYWSSDHEDEDGYGKKEVYMIFRSIKEARIAYNAAVDYYCFPNRQPRHEKWKSQPQRII
jgi:hypothetical protein